MGRTHLDVKPAQMVHLDSGVVANDDTPRDFFYDGLDNPDAAVRGQAIVDAFNASK